MTGSKETAQNKAEETRERILNAALELFREQGFEQTTMRQIASRAKLAVGAAYYYFESKDALVMAFYDRAQHQMEPRIEAALANRKDAASRLRAIVEAKFDHFGAERGLLGALSGHVDPAHPLSPFSEQSRPIRENDIRSFGRALEGTRVRIPADLRPHLPRILWMYQMGLLLFWVYDRSPQQLRTRQLLDKSLALVISLIKFSNFPLLRPVRKSVVDLMTAIFGDPETQSAGAGR